MDTPELLTHFNRLADAPGAVPRLRRLVLDLAVRGKLVAQDPGDEPARVLLERITAEKRTSAGSLRLALSNLQEEKSSLLTLPDHWQALCIANVLAELQTGPFGSSLHQSDYVAGGIPVINPASIQDGKIVPIESMAIGQSTFDRLSGFSLREGDIVMARRGEMGRCALVTKEEAGWLCGTGCLILRPSKLIYAPFLSMFVGSPFARNYLGGAAVGTTMQNLNQSILLSMPFGLPPFSEQHRIVTKVDELMGLLDQIEARQTAREATRRQLTTASLARLSTSDTSPDDFRDHARFLLDHLPAHTTRRDQIKQLRQTILNLAVRGKLVEQKSEDEQTYRNLKLSEDSGFYLLPDSWHWARVDEVSSARLGKMLDKTKNRGKSRPYLRNANVRWFDFDLDELNEMPIEDHEVAELCLRPGDVLICEGGEPGRAAVWDGRREGVFFQKAIHRVRLSSFVDPWFFVFVVKSGADDGRLSKHFTGTGIKHLTGKGLASFHIPIPPLAEQHRIVAKVDELMALCDHLDAALDRAETSRSRLLDAELQAGLRDRQTA